MPGALVGALTSSGSLTLRNSIAYVISAAISIVLLEVVLQAYYRVTVGDFLFARMAIPIYANDPVRCFGVKPDLDLVHRTAEYEVRYTTDGDGFRIDGEGASISTKKEGDHVRILYLGPSYAFGWANAFHDSYAHLIAEGISVEARRVEVLNLGTPGQSVANQLCWVEKQAAKYEPDLVVQTVFGWPGVIADACSTSWCPSVKNGFLVKRGASLRTRFVEVAKDSAIVFYGWYVFQRLLQTDEGEQAAPNGSESKTGSRLADDELFSRYDGYLSLVRHAVGSEVPVIFIYIPYSYVVRPADSVRWGIYDPQTAFNTHVSVSARIARLKRRGVRIVDPTESLIEADQEERMYFFVDTHLTPAGNRVVAEEAMSEIDRSFSQSR